ncbi:hypothetical protein KFU94_50460 [Chloroflexi bacterium TSY]|nr:hypothetical protein [Chloroflexi bacterium TSY]
MYTVDVKVKGNAPLLQHRFPLPDFDTLGEGGRKQSGAIDYTQEWKEYLYVTKDDEIYQPAVHFEQTMIRAAVNFKIQGKRGKTYKNLFSSSVFVIPEYILHGIKRPESLTLDADERLYIDMRPVIVNRARVVRLRPAFSSGWELEFKIEVIDEQIPASMVQDVPVTAGKTVGIGDHRPRFGRFQVVRFDVSE